MNYIYILNLKIRFNAFGEFYRIGDIHNKIYYDYNTARSSGLDYIKESIKRYKKYSDIKSTADVYKEADIDFTITKVACDNLHFVDPIGGESENIRAKNIIMISSKHNLYHNMMRVVGEELIVLDHTGYPGLRVFPKISEYCSPKSFEYGKKYHLDKFKVGDKVKVRVPFEGHGIDKVYEVAEIINKDTSIYDSENPLEFRQGYLLTDIYDDYCNKYTQLHFDEDLILSSDEEWYDFYKSWDWYENNEVIGTYGDYINGRIK